MMVSRQRICEPSNCWRETWFEVARIANPCWLLLAEELWETLRALLPPLICAGLPLFMCPLLWWRRWTARLVARRESTYLKGRTLWGHFIRRGWLFAIRRSCVRCRSGSFAVDWPR